MKLIKELYMASRPYDLLFRCSTPKSLYEQYLDACEIKSNDIVLEFEDGAKLELKGNVASKVNALAWLEIVQPIYLSRLVGCALYQIIMNLKEGREVQLFDGIGKTGEDLNKIIEEVCNVKE